MAARTRDASPPRLSAEGDRFESAGPADFGGGDPVGAQETAMAAAIDALPN